MVLFFALLACAETPVVGGAAAHTCDTSVATLHIANPDGSVPATFEAEIQWYDDGYALIVCPDDGSFDKSENIQCVEGGVEVQTDASVVNVDIFGTGEGFGLAGEVTIEWNGETCDTGEANVVLEQDDCGDCG